MVLEVFGTYISYYGLVYGLGAVLFILLSRPALPMFYIKNNLLVRSMIGIYAAIGAIVGGRLGYVICYDPLYYAEHIDHIWQLNLGGMSYMGGIVGLALGLFLIVHLATPYIAHNPFIRYSHGNSHGLVHSHSHNHITANLHLDKQDMVADAAQYNSSKSNSRGQESSLLTGQVVYSPHIYRHIKKEIFYCYADRAVLIALLIIPLGRVANFFNGELYGTPSTLPWAVIFSNAGDLNPRHPVQIYEALAEGPLLALILLALLVIRNTYRAAVRKNLIGAVYYSKGNLRPGALTLTYLMVYAILRFICEFVREPDIQLGYILGPLSMGQIQCLFLLVTALAIAKFSKRTMW